MIHPFRSLLPRSLKLEELSFEKEFKLIEIHIHDTKQSRQSLFLHLLCVKYLLIVRVRTKLQGICLSAGKGIRRSEEARREEGEPPSKRGKGATMLGQIVILIAWMMMGAYAGDSNPVFSPCEDAKVKRFDGFTFGLVFSSKESFFYNQTQLSPCDRRLSLLSKAEVAVFRPKVDEISLLTINSSTFNPSKAGGYMVAFAGRQYAARSIPVFVADINNIVTSFTLVLEFKKGTLQNLFWKKYGCNSCTESPFVCLNNTDCGVPQSACKGSGGDTPCDVGIQLAFSGSDKNENVMNSWYEAATLRQYSLYGLYSDLRNSFTSSFKF